ncbi:sigma-54 interaction domain-containing protein [Caballeronia sp. DA-9]|uniref:sigma-54 interaction domain-containing protein n=1 Tax=Caballeronia sp. DA-9 TaxID=3436237 RepID=UPI003F67709D
MQILSLPNLAEHAISIRAKALAFNDEKSRHLFERIQLIAPSDATVLVTGESGTGKELIARLVHTSSTRADRPFVAVNCGAFSETLLESELFGHERGSFTGAIDSRPGWFEAASGGTLFLDEVGDLPLSAQVKLLRVLQEREVTRLGSRKALPIDVRLVAATNVRLEEAVRAGNFREDLYYRLDVAKIALPPLRERPADIEPLTRHFIDLYSRRLSVPPGGISDIALLRLKAHPWPGNIRELENVIHHTLLIRRGPQIEASDLHFSSLGVRETAAVQPSFASSTNARKLVDPGLRSDGKSEHMSDLRIVLQELFDRNVPDLWQEIESTVFTMAYDYCDRNQLQTSRLLTLSRNIVRTRLIQLGLLSSKVDAG